MAVIRDKSDQLPAVIYDGKDERFINGARQLVRPASLFDHFIYAGAFNSHLPQDWQTTETGAGAGKAIFAPSTTILGGAAVGVAGATTSNAEEIAGKYIAWECDVMAGTNSLILEVRAKFVGSTTPADGDFYVGFSDVVTAASGLMYTVSAASAITAQGATDSFAGIGYSSIPTSGALFNSGGNNFLGLFTSKAAAGSVSVSTPNQVKDSNFHIFTIALNSLGDVAAYVDDVWIGGKAAAITKTVPLTPYIGVVGKNSHNNTATVDYVAVLGDLV